MQAVVAVVALWAMGLPARAVRQAVGYTLWTPRGGSWMARTRTSAASTHVVEVNTEIGRLSTNELSYPHARTPYPHGRGLLAGHVPEANPRKGSPGACRYPAGNRRSRPSPARSSRIRVTRSSDPARRVPPRSGEAAPRSPRA